jgi:tRNA pseudouridine55 synthase
VTSLRRLYVEPFMSEPMHSLDSIAELRAAGRWPAILAADLAIGHVAAVHLDAAASVRLLHGQAVAMAAGAAAARVRLYDDSGRFLGMGERDVQGLVHPRRLFVL